MWESVEKTKLKTSKMNNLREKQGCQIDFQCIIKTTRTLLPFLFI